MKKIISLAIIVILCFSTFSMFAPQVAAQATSSTSDPTDDLYYYQSGSPAPTWPVIDIVYAEISQVDSANIKLLIQANQPIPLTNQWQGYNWLLDTGIPAPPYWNPHDSNDIDVAYSVQVNWAANGALYAQVKNATDETIIFYEDFRDNPSKYFSGDTVSITIPLTWIGNPTSIKWVGGSTDGIASSSGKHDKAPNTGHITLYSCLEPEILASGLDQPQGILVHDGFVYWAEIQGQSGLGGRIGKVSVDGGVATTFADITKPSKSIVTDGTHIYAVTELLAPGYVKKIRLSDGLITDLVSPTGNIHDHPWKNYPYNVALLDDKVYWSSSTHAGIPGGVWSIPKDGGSIQELARLDYHLAIDTSPGESWIYIVEIHQGDVMRVPTSVGAVEMLYDSPKLADMTAGFLDVANGYVYWPATEEGRIYRIPTGGGSVEVLAEGESHPTSVLVDGGYVYWTADTSISRAPIDGSGPVELLACGLLSPMYLTIADGSLYWSELGYSRWSPIPPPDPFMGTIKKIPLAELIPDFEISILPQPEVVVHVGGWNDSTSLRLRSVNGFEGTITLSFAPPSGGIFAIEFATNPVFLPEGGEVNVGMHVSCDWAPLSTYNGLITASSDSLEHELDFEIAVVGNTAVIESIVNIDNVNVDRNIWKSRVPWLSVQQNFVVVAPNGTKIYWAQNIVEIWDTGILWWKHIWIRSIFQVFTYDSNKPVLNTNLNTVASRRMVQEPFVLNLTSHVEGDLLILENDASQRRRGIEYLEVPEGSYIMGKPGWDAPQICLVGIPFPKGSTTAFFEHPTSGQVVGRLKLVGENTWRFAENRVFGVSGSQTGEQSRNLLWWSDGVFLWNAEGTDQGISFTPNYETLP